MLSASSDARHVGRAVTDALGSAFPRISFLVSHTGRLETTVEWAEGPQERDVLTGLVALFGAGFAIGADGRTIRDVRRRSAQPVLILVRHGEGPWRADFDDTLARGGPVGAAA